MLYNIIYCLLFLNNFLKLPNTKTNHTIKPTHTYQTYQTHTYYERVLRTRLFNIQIVLVNLLFENF